jgi:hypothetical protein
MGVVRAQAGRRWLVVAVGTAAVLAAPQAWAARPTTDSHISTAALVSGIERSARVQHSGLADVRGSLGLPDLPRLGDIGALLGGTSRARVWWAGPKAWRVDTLTATGETDVYGTEIGLTQWDFENHDRDITFGQARVRLPRTDDLLPPQLARRVLVGLGTSDTLERLGTKRVAGLAAEGLRIRPQDVRSTVEAVDIWADPVSGLPLEVSVRDKGHSDAAISSRFESVSLGAPDRLVIVPPLPADAPTHRRDVADLADSIDRFGEVVLPSTLAGETRGEDLVGSGSAETYGDGLTRFSVLALPGQFARRIIDSARTSGGQPLDVTGGEVLLLPSRLLTAVVARASGGGQGYLLVGTVDRVTLQTAAADLFADPPPFR